MTYSQFLEKLESIDVGDRRFDLDKDMKLLNPITIIYDDTIISYSINPSTDTLYLKPTLPLENAIRYKLSAITLSYMKEYNKGIYFESEMVLIQASLLYLLALLYHQPLNLYQFKDVYERTISKVIIDDMLISIKTIYNLIIIDL